MVTIHLRFLTGIPDTIPSVGAGMRDARDNAMWLKDLRSGEEQRDEALGDLRAMLLRVLPQGLARWLPPENPEFASLLEDTAQETLLRVMNGLDSFEGRSQFTTWAYKIAVRVALNELRRRKWRDVSLDGLEAPDSEGASPREFRSQDASPESIVERADVVQRVQRILAEELSERQRAAMMAINVEGVPMEEVARRLKTNRNALYKLLHDARVRLKERLEAEGLPPMELLRMFSQE
jgi:RNA polymerase sigma-70 factor (ECF subfamily)